MLTKLCDLFREDEENAAHASVVLLDEPPLQHLIAAFSLMTPPDVRFEHGSEAHKVLVVDAPIEGLPCGMAKAWDLLWENTVVEWKELQMRAGIDCPHRTRHLFKRLIAARLVYPDGTISETAKDILNARTIREIERATGKGGGGA